MSDFSINILLLVASVFVFVFLLRRNAGSNKRADAALNMLLAKHTFSQLSEDEKAGVELRTREIMAQRGQAPEFQGDVDRYGWYALAMSELGILHQAQGFKGWKAIGNPSTAIAPGDPLLMAATFLLIKKCGIDVSVS